MDSRTNALLTEHADHPGSASSPAVLLSGVTRVFGAVPAVVRADLRVDRGETVVVRGPNGAGKSTLLRLIATALSATFGSGTVLGFDLVQGREEIRRRTELLSHRTRLYEDLTGEENLRFICSVCEVDPGEIPGALERVGLGGVSGERVRGYSHGMRQRLALARALLRAPDLLLLDEPYAGLDALGKDLVDELARDATGRGGTVLVATHEPPRENLAGRILFMDAGRLLPELDGRSSAPSGIGRAAGT